MPVIHIELPAGIGEGVQVRAGEMSGQVALVIAWRLTRPRFTVGGALDDAPQLSLQVLTEQGEEFWLRAADVAGVDELVHVSVDLPFTGGDRVTILSSRATGEIRGWEITGRRLETSVTYRVRLFGGDVIEVDVRDLEPWTSGQVSGTA